MCPPNILLFLTDDHGAWALGSSGNSEIRSPHLDRMAAEGARFTNAFAPSPVCSPARACLLTGRTPSQVGIHDWIEEAAPECGDPDWLNGEITLAELLRDQGYVCGLSGKWHLGQSHLTPRGYDWYFGLPRWQGKHIERYTYVDQGRPVTLTGNKTEILTDRALAFLASAPSDRPFFLQVGYISTHSPYAGQDPALEALYDGAEFRDLPEYVPHPWHLNEGFPQGTGVTREDCRNRYRSYYAAVTDIDRNVGRLLAFLRERERLDDTLVVYASDHGCSLGHHGFWGKGNSTRPLNMHETCIRVPLIARWPKGIPAGTVIDRCVDHYDTFATLLDCAGLPAGYLDPERRYPGRSYREWLEDGGAARAASHWEDARFGEYGDLRMIRTPGWKLVRRYPSGPDDLFCLENDPEERVNLAGTPETAAIRTELERRLDAFYARHDDLSKSGLRVKELRRHSRRSEAWRDGIRESRGLQIY